MIRDLFYFFLMVLSILVGMFILPVVQADDSFSSSDMIDPEYSLDSMQIHWIRAEKLPQFPCSDETESFSKAGDLQCFIAISGVALSFPETEPAQCVIITTVDPKKDRDNALTALGYEFMNCFTGRWQAPSGSFMSAKEYRSLRGFEEERMAVYEFLRSSNTLSQDDLKIIEKLINEANHEQ